MSKCIAFIFILGIWRNSRSVAVKTLKPGSMAIDAFLAEAEILKKLRHPKIVSLYAVCSSEPLYIVTELMINGSLLGYLQNPDLGPKLIFGQLIGISSQVGTTSNKMADIFGGKNISLGNNHIFWKTNIQ